MVVLRLSLAWRKPMLRSLLHKHKQAHQRLASPNSVASSIKFKNCLNRTPQLEKQLLKALNRLQPQEHQHLSNNKHCLDCVGQRHNVQQLLELAAVKHFKHYHNKVKMHYCNVHRLLVVCVAATFKERWLNLDRSFFPASSTSNMAAWVVLLHLVKQPRKILQDLDKHPQLVQVLLHRPQAQTSQHCLDNKAQLRLALKLPRAKHLPQYHQQFLVASEYLVA